MSDELLILLSFLLFMGIFAGVGLASMRVKEDTTDDYLVAGRGMHPALAALSAVSTWNSGYMFIGFIGFIFISGYSALWIAIVSTIGQLVAWIWLYKYIQKEGKERNLRSLSSLVSNKTGAPEAKLAALLQGPLSYWIQVKIKNVDFFLFLPFGYIYTTKSRQLVVQL